MFIGREWAKYIIGDTKVLFEIFLLNIHQLFRNKIKVDNFIGKNYLTPIIILQEMLLSDLDFIVMNPNILKNLNDSLMKSGCDDIGCIWLIQEEHASTIKVKPIFLVANNHHSFT